MENNGNQELPPPTLCRSGCGFFGNPAFDGMCSKCYRDAVKRKQQQQQPSPAAAASPAAAGGRVSPGAAGPSSVAAVAPAAAADRKSSVQLSAAAMDTASPTVNLPRPASAAVASGEVASGASIERSDSATSCLAAADSSAAASAAADAPAGSAGKSEEKKSNRCSTCRKKVGLTGFQCRCGGLYCSVHRYSDKHGCTFDYKEHGAELIRKYNPVIVGEKVQKI